MAHHHKFLFIKHYDCVLFYLNLLLLSTSMAARKDREL